MKWDGVRGLATVEGGRVRLVNRSGGDISHRYPELRALGLALGSTEVVLDGELVVFDGPRPDFQLMQRRMHVDGERDIRRLATELPGRVRDLRPALARRSLDDGRCRTRNDAGACSALSLAGPAWQTPPHEVGDGSATLGPSSSSSVSKASSRSGSTRRTSRVGGRARG